MTKSNEHLHIFGSEITGRTYQAVTAAQAFKQVLYVSFDKDGLQLHAKETNWEVPNTWDTTIIRSWKNFIALVVNPIKRGENKYDCIVLDGYDVTPFQYLWSNSLKAPRDNYPAIATALSTAATILIDSWGDDKVGQLIITTLVMPTSDDDPAPRHFLSRTIRIKLFPKFAATWYTSFTNNKMCRQTFRRAASEFQNGKPVILTNTKEKQND